MTIGVAFSFKSNLGASPISSIPYSVSLIYPIDVGTSTIIFHCILVFIEFLLLRKAFEAKFLLQVVAGIIFGWFTNIAVFIVAFIPDFGIICSFIFLAISIVLVALGIFLYLPPDIIQLAGEGVMQAVSIVSHQPFPKIKVLFDSTMVIISFFLCGIFLDNFFASVGIGTVLAAILIGTTLKYIVKGYTKLSGKTVNLKQM